MSNNVFVIAEHLKGQLTEPTFEALGAARQLADALGGEAVAVLLGHHPVGMAEQLSAAHRILVVDHPALADFTPEAHLAVLTPLLRQRQPRLTLLLNTSLGMDLAAALSARLNWPLVAYGNGLRLENGMVIVTSQVYGGKILAECALPASAGLATVLAGAFPSAAGRGNGAPVVEMLDSPIPLDNLRTRFQRLIEPPAGDVDITRAAVIVSVGRGIQSKENIALAEELAQALGGVVAASRPVTDAAWLPRTRQVGKSGMKVKPKLYLALGISGAPEHVEGMKDSELIIAVNTDRKAPIFDIAHYGVTADLFDVAEAMLENL